jgi:hypothetical protein
MMGPNSVYDWCLLGSLDKTQMIGMEDNVKTQRKDDLCKQGESPGTETPSQPS